METHRTVSGWVLKMLAEQGLLKGNTPATDGTTLEPNAALRSIVHRETGDPYNEFLKKLAAESGIETPTRDQLAKVDRKRPQKGSNDEWTSPEDPDSRIVKMKDGRTYLAHKAEHAVDLETGAVVAVVLHSATAGDTQTVLDTLCQAGENICTAADTPASDISVERPRELVLDKGHHSNGVLRTLKDWNMRSYCSEPDRGRRRWSDKEAEKAAVYRNRRRIRGYRGKRLLRQRGEKVERSFAHMYETGAMRRTRLRRHPNILKRLLIHADGKPFPPVVESLITETAIPAKDTNGKPAMLLLPNQFHPLLLTGCTCLDSSHPSHYRTLSNSCTRGVHSVLTDCFQSPAADERDSRRRYAETNAGEGSGRAYYSGFIEILLLWAEPV